MILGPEVFSLRDINQGEMLDLRQMLGGAQVDPRAVQHIMETGGSPMLRQNSRLIRLMGATLAGLAEGRPNTPELRRALSSGALLYASVFGFVNRTDRLPVKDEAIETVEGLELLDLMTTGRDGIRERNPGFAELLRAVLPAAGVPVRLEEVAQTGAGTLHMVVECSVPQLSDLSAFETDDTLADLRELFKDSGF